MTGDEWWWTHLERKGCLWGDEVMWKRAWKDRRTTQNVEYSTIPKYTKYTEYTKYTKYTKYTTYSTIAFYIHCHIYMFHDFCSLVAQSLASALWCGVQTCAILCTAPVGNLDKRNLASALWCGVQITLLLVPLKSWRGGRYIQNIYKIYTAYIQLSLLVKFFLHCDFKHFAFDVSQILVRLKKTGYNGTTGERANGYIPVLGQITQG